MIINLDNSCRRRGRNEHVSVPSIHIAVSCCCFQVGHNNLFKAIYFGFIIIIIKNLKKTTVNQKVIDIVVVYGRPGLTGLRRTKGNKPNKYRLNVSLKTYTVT